MVPGVGGRGQPVGAHVVTVAGGRHDVPHPVILEVARNCGQALVSLPAEGGYGQESVTEESPHAPTLLSKPWPSIKQKLRERSDMSGFTNGVNPTPLEPP
jgi:hypothetical protein